MPPWRRRSAGNCGRRCTAGSLCRVRIVLVSSPGGGATPHWSHGYASELGSALLRAGAAVTWFATAFVGQPVPPPPVGIEQRCGEPRSRQPLHRAAADNSDVPLESALARALREQPAAAVVHIGAGARGTPNVAWLAERMGSVPFAVVRAAEVVCHRGDLIEADGSACREPLQPDRCRRCCSGSWWQQPRSDELQNRADLLAGSLLAADAVFVAEPADADLLRRFGANERSLVLAADAEQVAARILAALR